MYLQVLTITTFENTNKMKNSEIRIHLTTIASFIMTCFFIQGTAGITKMTHVPSSSLSMQEKEKTSYRLERSNKFDEIANQIYKEANTEKMMKRSDFTLDGWERGTGGLDDADRLTIGKLYKEANSVFEFGLGESTYIASFVNVPRYAGVDSDAKWVSDARDVVAKQNNTHFRFHFADIGMTKSWGTPTNLKLQKIKYNYQIQSLFSEIQPFDVYMVDGRYRVACACMSFLHAMKYGANMEKVRVLTHDNDKVRRGYDILQQIADLEIKNTKLWVYKLKPSVMEDDIVNMYHKSMNDKW